MNILDRKVNVKVLGVMMVLSSLIILLSVITIPTILLLAGIKSGVSFLALLPLICVSLFVLALAVFGIYQGIKFFRKNGFKQNKSLGKVLILLGLGYLGYILLSYLFSNLTGNTGGELRIVFALLFSLITVPLGMALKNGIKK